MRPHVSHTRLVHRWRRFNGWHRFFTLLFGEIRVNPLNPCTRKPSSQPIFLLLFALALVACGSAPTPTLISTSAVIATQPIAPATLAPGPTLEVIVTVTAPPRTAGPATPTFAVPLTPTAEALATPDPHLGVGEIIYADALDGSSDFDWALNEEGVTFALGGGQLNAVMTQANVGGRFMAREDVSGGDQQARVTARANLCYDLDEYGLLFRGVRDSLNNYHYYLFKLTCAGMMRVELIQNFETTVLVDWTTSLAIVPGAPAENTLMVWAAQARMHFFINDRYIASATDDTLASGFWGFYLRDRTLGGESVSFVNLIAREVKAP